MSVKFRKSDLNNQDSFDRKWKLGSCDGPKSFPSLWPIPKEADLIYFEKCCLATGIYTLICNNDLGPFGWGNSFIEILGERYCDDFVGYKALRRVVISGNQLAKTVHMLFLLSDILNLSFTVQFIVKYFL